jgi:hypothetical protein
MADAMQPPIKPLQQKHTPKKLTILVPQFNPLLSD